MSTLAASVRAFIKVSRDLRPFLAAPIRDRAAVSQLEQRLRDREQSLARLLEIAVSANPSAPTARLLAHAGVEVGDLNSSVQAVGLESTLERLHAEGVRLTLPEMRGRTPIVRPGLEIDATIEDFANPLLRGAFDSRSGGSTGARSRTTFDLATVADDAVYWSLFRQIFGIEGRPVALWYPCPPGGAGIKNALSAAKVGEPPEHWFSQTPLRWTRGEARYAILARHLAWASHGAIPLPEHVPPDRVGRVVEWIAGHVAQGRSPVLMSTPSSAARVCAAAARDGVDIAGTFFRCGGEPYTAAKDAAIRRAGCLGAANYYASELGGPIGVACGKPIEPGEVHVCADRIGLIEVEAKHAGGEVVRVLAGTTLSLTGPTFVINLELDDYATVDRRACGCPLDALGFPLHVRTIRSHAKLTVEGMHFLGDELLQLLQETLPRRFGGDPTSYQLEEHEDERGRTRVLIVVSPRVGPIDEPALLEAALAELARGGPAQKMMAEVWDRAGTLGVVRREPLTTAASKTPPLVRATR